MQTSDTVSGHNPVDDILSESPARVLVVGQCPQAFSSDVLKGVSVQQVSSLEEAESLGVASGSATTRHDDKVPESLVLQLEAGTDNFEQSLGRAVRAFPHRVLVHYQNKPDSKAPADEIFFALGFHRLIVVSDGDQSAQATHWFEYRLSHYKVAPDWLNARFWANPERFNVDEDPDDYFEESDDDEEE